MGSFNSSVTSNSRRPSSSRIGFLNSSSISKPSSQSSLWGFFGGVGNDSSSGVATPGTEASATDYQSAPQSPRLLDVQPSSNGSNTGTASKKPTIPKSYVQELTQEEDGTEQADDWGHYVDVLEAEEKIVRASKILSRRASVR